MMFTNDVQARLKYYVYRLIDPRNGETFYVGKGKGNRVFAHAKGEIPDDDAINEKLKRIREIRRDNFEVAHVIHRHGLEEQIAFEVEASLIDAYPEVTNLMGGRASDERGLMHSQQIIDRFTAKEAILRHSGLLININRSAVEKDIYEAVRYAWKVDPQKAMKAELVLAVIQGLIVGVFVPEKWMEATKNNFPGLPFDQPGRWGFEGNPAPLATSKRYKGYRVPDTMRKKGAANPIRYFKPDVL